MVSMYNVRPSKSSLAGTLLKTGSMMRFPTKPKLFLLATPADSVNVEALRRVRCLVKAKDSNCSAPL